MPESELTLGYPELIAELGFALGYGRDPEAWDATQEAEVLVYLQAGLRQFYHPPPVGDELSHAWKFFKPVAELVTVADQGEYDAPDDFGGMEGDMTFDAEEGYSPVVIVAEGYIRQLRQRDLGSGRPRFVAARPKAFDPSTGQRFELIFDRPADGVYHLGYTYNVIPPVKLSADTPYIYGGEAHSETILASCLAVIELRAQGAGKGPMWEDFTTKLAASIAVDRRSVAPVFLGYNGDRSGAKYGDREPRTTNVVTVNGVAYP